MVGMSSSSIEEILRAAREAGASDVHLTVGLPPKMRVGGSLVSMSGSRILAADTLDILIAIMPEALRTRFEEKGEYVFSFTMSDGGRCRVAAYKQRGGVALAFRLIAGEIPAPEELGIPEAVAELYQKRSGLVLVTGASGSGKSTTLAAIVNQINDSEERLVITLEDPVEYLHGHKRAMVNQREVGLDCESYVDGIRGALREDADVILIGNLCDAETVSAAIEAEEAGHLVLAGLNSAGAVDCVEKLLDMFPPHRQERMRARLAGALEAVVFQRLIPTSDGDGQKAAFEVLAIDPKVLTMICGGRIRALSDAVQSWGLDD